MQEQIYEHVIVTIRHVVKGTAEHEDPHDKLQLMDPAQNNFMSYRQEFNEYYYLWLVIGSHCFQVKNREVGVTK